MVVQVIVRIRSITVHTCGLLQMTTYVPFMYLFSYPTLIETSPSHGSRRGQRSRPVGYPESGGGAFEGLGRFRLLVMGTRARELRNVAEIYINMAWS